MYHRLIQAKKAIGKFVANFAVVEQDGKQYIYDGEVLREGLDINTYDENGDIVPLTDGEYVIGGVKVKVAEGKVIELPEKESKVEMDETPIQTAPEAVEDESKTEAENEPSEDWKLKYEALKAEYDDLKAQMEKIKKTPMGEPVPQRTDMSSVEDETPDNVKGTKFERAYKLMKQ